MRRIPIDHGSRPDITSIDHGCRVTAFDSSPLHLSGIDAERFARLHLLDGDVYDEDSVRTGLVQAQERFGPTNILLVNPSFEDTRCHCPIWDVSVGEWEKSYTLNARGSFLAIKHFLRCMREYQRTSGAGVESPAIVLVERETGTAHMGGQAGLHSGLLHTVRGEIKTLKADGRINVVTGAAGENDATSADVARTIVFLASKRAAGHISGQYIHVGGGKDAATQDNKSEPGRSQMTRHSIPQTLSIPKRNKIRVAVSIDLDAVSGWLGTSTPIPSE